jgi:glycosyltransferase involved in cell wall biosynthesis
MKIAIATDAWDPQTNGVVTSLKTTIRVLEERGHEVHVLNALNCKTFPLPTYPSIRLALFPYRYVKHALDNFKADIIHIATEGTLGWATRRYCLRNKLKFTTSYHTQFPEYIRLRAPIPLSWSYRFMAHFHNKAERTMVATQSMENALKPWVKHLARWTRGVDTNLFKPYDKDFLQAKRPVAIFVGRIAVEKNIEDFLKLGFSGSKYVVGDGPDFEMLKAKYPEVTFTGLKKGKELAQHIAAADVFVFPSKTDTFGLVMLEAMSCGIPVAAYPVIGPVDVVENNVTGALDNDLGTAITRALKCSSSACREYALKNTWAHATDQFFNNLEINGTEKETQNDQGLAKQSP